MVAALRKLSVFSADQAGAYREHFAPLGRGARQTTCETKLGRYVIDWAEDGVAGRRGPHRQCGDRQDRGGGGLLSCSRRRTA